MAYKSPFSRQDFDRLARDMTATNDIEEQIKRMEDCGIDCAPQRQALEGLRQRQEAYRNNFFNPVPK